MSLAHIQGLTELKDSLGKHLRASDRLKKPEGLPTGFAPLDQFLFWGGFPKGALSLMRGPLGTGATSMWLEAAHQLLKSKHWIVWVNGEVPLSPLPLHHKGMDLGHFVTVEKPDTDKKLFCLLEELMSAGLFDLIGCDLGTHMLKEHQLRKLQAQARASNTALVFLMQNQYRPQFLNGSLASLFSLILGFETKSIQVERALHRPTPRRFTRSVSYARFTQHVSQQSALTPSRRSELPSSARTEPRSLFEAASSAAQGE